MTTHIYKPVNNSATVGEVAYNPATPGDWSPVPTTVSGALDQLAANSITVYSNTFLVVDWSLSSPNYIITIPVGVHGKGLTPQVSVYEKVGSDYVHIELGEIRITSTGSVVLMVNDVPDLRFEGKVQIY